MLRGISLAVLASGLCELSGCTPDQEFEDRLEPGAPVLPYARDIRLVGLAANQGVEVTLVQDGVVVPSEGMSTRLISGRRTMIRGLWSLRADFEPRPLTGRLILDYPDETQIVQDVTGMVAGPSGEGDDMGHFLWLVESVDVVPGMTYRAQILELEPETPRVASSESPPVLPLEGAAPLPLYDVPLAMRVMLVPINHSLDDCQKQTLLNPYLVSDLETSLQQLNPVRTVEVRMHQPMAFGLPLSDKANVFQLLAEVARLRDEEDADPAMFFYAIVDSCDGFPPKLVAQAITIPEEHTADNDEDRIAVAVLTDDLTSMVRNAVHEIGHGQGRRHVLCSGAESLADPNYPYPQGRIGVWGFGIVDEYSRAPNLTFDYMSYCEDVWVSDYGWEHSIDVLEQLSSLGSASARGREGRVLTGLIDEDGSAVWWLQSGQLPSRSNGSLTSEGLALDRAVSIQPVPHAEGARYVKIAWDDALGSMPGLRLHSSAAEWNLSFDPSPFDVAEGVFRGSVDRSR